MRKNILFPLSGMRALARCCIALLLCMLCWTGAAQAALFGGVGIKDEKEMGRKFEVMVRSRLPLVEDPEVTHYVQSVVDKLAGGMPPQPFPFRAGVVRHNALNAFAVPGGNVFVFTGLLMELDSEAGLAGIMAHEMAHVTQRHIASRIEKAQYVTLGSLLVAVAGAVLGGGAGAVAGALGAGQSAMLNYSRIDENEADHQGFQYLLAAGYPPQGMVEGFSKIRQKSWMSGTEVPAYLSTHPELGSRISGIEARIRTLPEAKKYRQRDERRFQRVQTLLWARYGDTQAAMQRFSRAGNTGLALMGKGILLARRHDISAAGTAFAAAEQAAPQDSLVLRECGAFQYMYGDTARAEALLRRALTLDPHDYMAHFFYARLLADTGRTTEAIHRYHEVLRHVPGDAEVHDYYARALGQQGQNFLAHLHLAYSGLYANDKRKTQRFAERARSLAATPEQRRQLATFEQQYAERKEIWEAS